MKRPILIITLGYIIGIIWGVYLKTTILPILILYLIYSIIYKKIDNIYFRKYLKKTVILILIISAIISNTITLYLNNKYDNLYSNLENINLIGTVVSSKEEKQYKDIYKIKVNKINGNKKYKNTYLYLNINKKENIELKYGNLIKINCNFEEPMVARNYKGFDYKNYLKTNKIYGNIILKGKIKTIKKRNINLIFYFSNYLNQKIKNNIKNILPEKNANLLIGMLLGEKQKIEENIIENFKINNLSHLLAVSGSHINYLIIGISLLFKFININKKKAKIVTIIFLVFFMFLTNFQTSVVRACICSILILFGGIIYKQTDTINAICFSILIILIQNPFSINSLSFQLSFGGTIGIILFYKFLYKERKK